MSNGPEDPDVVVAMQQEEAKARKAKVTSTAGIVAETPRKARRIGSTDPRNAIEHLFMQKYGTVTPIPDQTQGRKQSIISAAILYIHYNRPLAECAKLCNVKYQYLQDVVVEDKWEEFAQELSQLNRPSNITLVPSHDVELISEEAKRRLGSIEELREKERQILLALKKMVPGSMQEGGALTNIKRIRELIERAIGMDDYLAELTAARKTILSGQAKRLLEPGEEGPRATKGTVVDL